MLLQSSQVIRGEIRHRLVLLTAEHSEAPGSPLERCTLAIREPCNHGGGTPVEKRAIHEAYKARIAERMIDADNSNLLDVTAGC